MKSKRLKEEIVWFDECTELTSSNWAKIKRNNARRQIAKNTTAAINKALGLPKKSPENIFSPELLKHSTQLEYRYLPRRETNEPIISDIFNDHCVIGINERMVND